MSLKFEVTNSNTIFNPLHYCYKWTKIYIWIKINFSILLKIEIIYQKDIFSYVIKMCFSNLHEQESRLWDSKCVKNMIKNEDLYLEIIILGISNKELTTF